VTRHRRPNWKDLVVERATSSGIPYLDPSDGHGASVYRSRVDVLDLNTASIVASMWHEGFLLGFVERDVMLRLDYGADGEPLLQVLKMTFRVGSLDQPSLPSAPRPSRNEFEEE
jgi:hypothetical protein